MGIFDAMCLGAAVSGSLGYDPARKAGMQAMFAEFDRQAQKRKVAENVGNATDSDTRSALEILLSLPSDDESL